ncbi:MAG: hypothetical protein CL814_11490 [Confluentimicrobium sp.]|jgi:hypothetical protein|uniref:Uncharacterized protein n=1 Tax=Actibacterium naphthalenivorans TaxID=1614693 RepID=A0A840CMM6_9RHOB|nr:MULTISPECIES: hypothetical protein [Actibacterium]KGB81775.1 glyceraldehyde-3-phosphate dehydrogenase [Rhodovulum sp. NI22]MDY6860364.1 hypothetical protein [Pseudomonadota bacterium]ALG90584.1 glyceraldehyde-3-phosphate dehydrogenase [Actibacterium sp. EMB200-NS6]MBB4023247.1 hypothetical protein [Actibacterium naphthalenivorans]MBC57542.1 hypothetical protein [Actibacterium sp.]|tara:strand:- start:442 stop:585 length:144 start_codon:yes stop_codon:yes gene_type:complete
MTNKLAIFLGGVIIVLLLVDLVFGDMQSSLFLAKKLAALSEYIAFWR